MAESGKAKAEFIFTFDPATDAGMPELPTNLNLTIGMYLCRGQRREVGQKISKLEDSTFY